MTIRNFTRQIVAGMALTAPGWFLIEVCAAAPFQAARPAQKKEQDALMTGPAFTLQQIIALKDVYVDRLSKAITARGLAFEATAQNVAVLRTAGVSTRLIDLIRKIAPPKPVAIPPPPPPPPTAGVFVVHCAPEECEISIDGESRGVTHNGALEVRGLPVKSVAVDFRKDGYVSQQKIVALADGKDAASAAELEPTNATKEQFGSELLSQARQALGGESLKDAASLWGSGSAVIWTKDGQRTDWTLNALLKMPSMVLFDLQRSDGEFWVSLIGDQPKSGGNRNKFEALIGPVPGKSRSPASAGGLDTALHVFRDFQISTILDKIKGASFVSSAHSTKPDEKGELHVHAADRLDSYDLTLGAGNLPVSVKYRAPLGLGSGLEILYSDYNNVGQAKYPYTLVIQLPDAPHYGMEFRFEKVVAYPALTEKNFSERFKPPRK